MRVSSRKSILSFLPEWACVGAAWGSGAVTSVLCNRLTDFTNRPSLLEATVWILFVLILSVPQVLRWWLASVTAAKADDWKNTVTKMLDALVAAYKVNNANAGAIRAFVHIIDNGLLYPYAGDSEAETHGDARHPVSLGSGNLVVAKAVSSGGVEVEDVESSLKTRGRNKFIPKSIKSVLAAAMVRNASGGLSNQPVFGTLSLDSDACLKDSKLDDLTARQLIRDMAVVMQTLLEQHYEEIVEKLSATNRNNED